VSVTGQSIKAGKRMVAPSKKKGRSTPHDKESRIKHKSVGRENPNGGGASGKEKGKVTTTGKSIPNRKPRILPRDKSRKRGTISRRGKVARGREKGGPRGGKGRESQKEGREGEKKKKKKKEGKWLCEKEENSVGKNRDPFAKNPLKKGTKKGGKGKKPSLH